MTIAVLWFWLYLHVKLEKQATYYLFNWIKLCSSLLHAEQKLSRCRMRERESERERCVCVCWTETEPTQREREREMCVRVLNRNWADAERERERDVCAGAEQKLSRRRERERERERCVHVLGKQDLMWQYRRFSETKGLGAFFRCKKVAKGVAMLLSWQHCASPFLQLRVGPRVKHKIHAALIKWVPLKGICIETR